MRSLFATRRARVAVVAAAAAGLLIPAAAAIAAFSGSVVTGAATLTSAASYGDTYSWSSYIIRDASDGTESTPADPLADDDGSLAHITGYGFTNAYQENRHVDFSYNSPLAPGTAITSAAFEMHWASSDTFASQLIVKLYRESTMTLLYTSPEQSVTSTGTTITLLDLSPYVTTSDVADDLLVRILSKNNWTTTSDDGLWIDKATLTGTSASGNFSLNREHISDTVASGNPAAAVTTPWPLVALDGTEYSSKTGWGASFGANYIRYQFPYRVPVGTTVYDVNLNHSFRSSSGTLCYYVNIYTRTGTLLASHGSSGSPYSCNSTSALKHDVIALPELEGSDAVNGFQARFYFRSSTGVVSRTDLLTVDATY